MAIKTDAAVVKTGIINKYVVMPKNLTEYTAFRGVTDFTQIGQFNQFETGYSFLSVISMPKFITILGDQKSGTSIKTMANSFRHMLEYEFRGLSGLPDVQGQTGTITDGINELNYINRVTMDTSITVSMPYFEKSGSLITRFTEYYLTGIKDKLSQAKTYHGLIRSGILEPGLENEVFTLMYYVTDNTYLRLERAVLLANAQLVNAETSMYDSNRSDINNREMNIQFNAFPVTGEQVDHAGHTLLQQITGVNTGYGTDGNGEVSEAPYYAHKSPEGSTYSNSDAPIKHVASLDSSDYLYGIMDADRKSSANIRNPILTNAIAGKASTSGTGGKTEGASSFSDIENEIWN